MERLMLDTNGVTASVSAAGSPLINLSKSKERDGFPAAAGGPPPLRQGVMACQRGADNCLIYRSNEQILGCCQLCYLPKITLAQLPGGFHVRLRIFIFGSEGI